MPDSKSGEGNFVSVRVRPPAKIIPYRTRNYKPASITGGLIIDCSAKRRNNVIGLPENKRTRVVLLDERSIKYLLEWKKKSSQI